MAGRLRRSNMLICVLVAAMVVTPVLSGSTLEGSVEHNAPKSRADRDGSSLCRSSCSTPASHGGHGSYTPAPTHDGGGRHGTPTTPSHGGGGYYAPPSDGGSTPTTPYTPTPRTPTYTPAPPTTTPCTPTPGTPTYTPTTPYTPTPTTPTYTPTPTTPYTPTPTVPYVDPHTATPTTPYTPAPGISTPPSPLLPGTNLPPFFTGTCDYWSSHPQVIWGVLGYWGTLGGLFGAAGTPVAGVGVLDALRNTRTDGIGALYREGTAAFLNSMVNQKFAFSTPQVRDAFVAALRSEPAAATQAQIFKIANEGHVRH